MIRLWNWFKSQAFPHCGWWKTNSWGRKSWSTSCLIHICFHFFSLISLCRGLDPPQLKYKRIGKSQVREVKKKLLLDWYLLDWYWTWVSALWVWLQVLRIDSFFHRHFDKNGSCCSGSLAVVPLMKMSASLFQLILISSAPENSYSFSPVFIPPGSPPGRDRSARQH